MERHEAVLHSVAVVRLREILGLLLSRDIECNILVWKAALAAGGTHGMSKLRALNGF